jgi:polysaccharide biosynthesis/export protein
LLGVLALISSVFLVGCTYAPGMSLKVDSINNPPASVTSKVKIVRIDSSLTDSPEYLGNTTNYQIGQQDVLNIIIWDHPELTIPAGSERSVGDGGIEVGADGKIFYPFAGDFIVQGATVQEIRNTLSDKLRKYIQTPQVSVRVATFNSQKVQVLGDVISPQTEAITNVPLSLINAINAAGSFDNNSANPTQVYVIRPAQPLPIIFTLNANDPGALIIAEHFYLKDFDVVYVSTAAVARWNKLLINLLPSVAATSQLHSTGDEFV